MSEEGNDRVVYPVGTWWLHDVTKLPICWLFLEWDEQDQATAIIYDGEKYRLYQGSLTEKLHPLADDLYGRRQEDDFDEPVQPDKEYGVKLVRLREGLVTWELIISSEEEMGIASYGWHRPSNGQPVSGCQVNLENYRVSIYPDDNYAITITER